MDWTAVGAIGEVAGAIAVFATLVYLSAQIRAASKYAELDSMRAVSEGMKSFSGAIASSKQVASVYRRGLQDPEGLDPDEHVQFEMLMLLFFDTLEEWNRRTSETSRTQAWRADQMENIRNAIAYMLGQPGGRMVWESYQMMYPTLAPLMREVLTSLGAAQPNAIPSDSDEALG